VSFWQGGQKDRDYLLTLRHHEELLSGISLSEAKNEFFHCVGFEFIYVKSKRETVIETEKHVFLLWQGGQKDRDYLLTLRHHEELLSGISLSEAKLKQHLNIFCRCLKVLVSRPRSSSPPFSFFPRFACC
jgi:hypothetical protein